MLNQLVIAGVVKSLEDKKITLFIPEDNLTLSVNLSSSLFERSKSVIEEDMIVAIKGKIMLNEENKIDVKAEKLFGLEKAAEPKQKKYEYER